MGACLLMLERELQGVTRGCMQHVHGLACPLGCASVFSEVSVSARYRAPDQGKVCMVDYFVTTGSSPLAPAAIHM